MGNCSMKYFDCRLTKINKSYIGLCFLVHPNSALHGSFTFEFSKESIDA